MGIREDGSLDRRHRTGKTEAQVTGKVRALESARDSGQTSKPGRVPTVEQWIRTWLETVAPRSASQSTIESNYRPMAERWIIPRLGKHRLDRLLPEHLDAFYLWLREQGLSDKTILNIHRILSRALKIAARREIIRRNVATFVDAPSAEEAEIEPLDEDEARAILEVAAPKRNGTRWSVGLGLRLRQAEALGLRWKYIQWPKCRRHPKQGECPADCPDAAPPKLEVHWQLKRLRYRHGCDDPHACGKHREACPEACGKHRRRADCQPGCAKKRHVCPQVRPCPPDCTGHASACPQRTGG